MRPPYFCLIILFCLSFFFVLSLGGQTVLADMEGTISADSNNPPAIAPVSPILIPSGITGYLYADGDDVLLPPIRVTAYLNIKNKWKKVTSVYSDGDSVYLLKGLDPGIYRLRFSDPSKLYQTEYYEDVHTLNDATDIVVLENQLTSGINATMSLADPGFVRQEVAGGE